MLGFIKINTIVLIYLIIIKFTIKKVESLSVVATFTKLSTLPWFISCFPYPW